ncbi:MAG: hypothetical protein R2778_18505 [Saprospiraceae bacterium]
MISAGKNNIKAASSRFHELKKLKVTEPMLKEQIKEVEKQMKQAGQGMNPSADGHDRRKSFRQGGKRRQPKMPDNC